MPSQWVDALRFIPQCSERCQNASGSNFAKDDSLLSIFQEHMHLTRGTRLTFSVFISCYTFPRCVEFGDIR